MARILSTILTVMTVLTLTALVVVMVIEPLIEADLRPLIGPLIWTLAVFISIRLLLNIRRLKSQAAAPLLASASVQSTFSGFPPGASRLEEPGATYTTSKIEDGFQQNGTEGGPR